MTDLGKLRKSLSLLTTLTIPSFPALLAISFHRRGSQLCSCSNLHPGPYQTAAYRPQPVVFLPVLPVQPQTTRPTSPSRYPVVRKVLSDAVWEGGVSSRERPEAVRSELEVESLKRTTCQLKSIPKRSVGARFYLGGFASGGWSVNTSVISKNM